MAIYSSRKRGAWARPPVTDAAYLSPNYLTGIDPRYSPSASLQQGASTGATPSHTERIRTTHLYGGQVTSSWGSFFYERYRYLYQGTEFTSTLSLGALSSDRMITITAFSGFKEKQIVASVSVTSGMGITVSSPSVSERVQAYSEYSIELDIAKEGPPSVSASIEVVFENGRSWVIPISFLRITVPVYLLEANWAEGVSLSRSFLTDIFVGASMAQTRKSLRKIPVRRQEVSMTFKDRESALRAWSLSGTVLSDYFYFPLYMDETPMSSANEGNKIMCDPSYRRFEEGQYVLLRHLTGTGDASGDIIGSQSYEITQVEDDGITVDASDLEAYQAGDVLYPLMKCLPNASNSSIAGFTRRKGTVALQVTEDWGDGTLPLENGDYVPDTLSDLPLFDFDIDEAEDTEITFMQGGDTAESGRGFAVTLYGEPYQSQSLKVLAESRSKYWDLLGFFNYIKGRGKPFWVKGYQDFLDLVEQDGDEYLFESDLTTSDLSGLAYLWVEDADGNKDIVQILGALDTDLGFTITCSTSSIVTNAVGAYQALAVRMSSDLVTEEWLTTSAVQISFTVEEVQGIYLT